jgi:hypothetical protein
LIYNFNLKLKNTMAKQPKTDATTVEKVVKTVKKAAKPKAAPAPKTEPVVENTTAEPQVETPQAEAPKTAKKPKSTLSKMIDAGNTTRKIVTKAGGKIIGSSIQTTKTVAGMYAKAGKKAFEIGKELIGETTKIVVKNQKSVRATSVEAFKETVETIKDAKIIENPLKGMTKPKKK